MKLEDIKKMSDEEFIRFMNKLQNIKEERTPQEDLKETKKLVNFGSILPGLATGLIPFSILENFTDDYLILGSTYVIGTIVGIPIIRKLHKLLYVKVTNIGKDLRRQELIELKKELESLTEEEFSFLVGIKGNTHIYGLYKKITETFGEQDSNKFIDTLQVTYKDDEDLGYSKNIRKSN